MTLRAMLIAQEVAEPRLKRETKIRAIAARMAQVDPEVFKKFLSE